MKRIVPEMTKPGLDKERLIGYPLFGAGTYKLVLHKYLPEHRLFEEKTMKSQIPDDVSLISDQMLEHVIGARASDAQFEQGVQYFMRFSPEDLKSFAKWRKPFFYNKFGNDLTSYGLTNRDDMIAAYHEAMARI
jgi:hypothetical protein